MTKPRFRRQFDKSLKYKGETNNLPSKTVPDMSIGLEQLLANHTRGINQEHLYREGIYSDQEIPKFDDFTDRDDFYDTLIEKKKLVEEQILKEKELLKQQREPEKQPEKPTE